MKIIFKIAILFLLVQHGFAQEEILDNATKWMDYSNENAFKRNFNYGQLTIQNFTNSDSSVFEFETTEQPKFIYNFSFKLPTKKVSVKKGQTILLKFKAKTIHSNLETGEAKILWIIKQSTDASNGYKFNLEATTSLSKDWKTYYIPFKTTKNVDVDDFFVVMQLGFPKQKFQITDLDFYIFPENYDTSSLPKTKINYAGMEENAKWREEANKRIEEIRKGNFTITFTKNGKPVTNNDVSLIQEKHEFPFGAACDAEDIVNSPEHLNYFSKMFTIGVFANDLKIKRWQNPKKQKTTLEAIEILQQKGIAIKGHTLVWPGFRYLTDDFKENENNPKKIISLTNSFVEDVLKKTNGKISHWDVTNENYTNKDLQLITGTNQIIYNAFLTTKTLDPKAKRYINEYGIISSGGIDKTKQEWYFNYIKELDANTENAVDGIGIQSHIGSDLTPPTTILEILDFYSKLNKEISISEFTMDITDPEIRYKYTSDFLTAAFSHPSVTEFLFWGYYMPNNPKAGLFTKDFKLTAMGKAFYNLVHNKWKTKLFVSTDKEGKIYGRGFYGFYIYKLNYDGKQYTGVLKIEKGSTNNIIINLTE